MSIDKNADNIQVMVRVRPLNSRELLEDTKYCALIDETSCNTILLETKPDQKKFNFDWVGGDNTTQETVFEVAGKPMVQACLEGYNCCIFAYGQTGAGKTFTMQGKGFENEDHDVLTRGLQPRVFDHIFEMTCKEARETPDIEYLISCNYLEIYNEQIMDLLEPMGKTLQVREDLKKGVYVEGLKDEIVSTSEETIELLRKGALNRHVGSTNMNMESSRSHSVFAMTIESKKCVDGIIHIKTSKFNFVDLAGSERQKQTASVGERLKEAGNINKSLLVLGQVINSLVESAEGKKTHIRYRDSKLTFILRDSLGGNAKTCLIANISPALSALSETLSTLKFAQRAKQIKNQAQINEDSSGNVEALKREIRRLTDELAQARSAGGVGGPVVCVAQPQPQPQPQFQLQSQFQVQPVYQPIETIQIVHVNSIPEGQEPWTLKPEEQKRLLDSNCNFIEVETMLRQNLESMLENQSLLHVDIARKEEYVNVFKSAVDLYNMNELQYRSIIALYNAKMKKWNKALAQKGADLNSFLLEENTKLVSERDFLINIVKNTPLVMKVFVDNIDLREKLEAFEGDCNPTSSRSIAKLLKENLRFLKNTVIRVEEDIKTRETLTDIVGKMNGFNKDRDKSNETTEIHQTSMETGDLDQMDFELFGLKQRENEDTKIMHHHASKLTSRFSKKYNNLEEFNKKNQEKKKKKLNELIKAFKKTQYFELAQAQLEPQADTIMNENSGSSQSEGKIFEEETITNMLSSLEKNSKDLSDNLSTACQNTNELSSKFSGIDTKQKYLNMLMNQEMVIKIEADQEYGVHLLRENVKVENSDSDQPKLLTELTNANQPLSSSVADLQEKAQFLREAYNELSSQKKISKQLERKISEQDELVKLLKSYVISYDSAPPFYLMFQDDLSVNDEIILFCINTNHLETIVETKEAEVRKYKEQANGLCASVDKYAQTCRDLFDKLETNSIQPNGLHVSLGVKISEALELQKEVGFTNHQLGFHKDEIAKFIHLIEGTRQKIPADLHQQLEKIQNEKSVIQLCLDVKSGQVKALTEQITQQKSNISELEMKLERAENIYKNDLNRVKQRVNTVELASGEKSDSKYMRSASKQDKDDIIPTPFSPSVNQAKTTPLSFLPSTPTSKAGLSIQRSKFDEYRKKILELEQSISETRRKYYKEALDLIQNNQDEENRMIVEEGSISLDETMNEEQKEGEQTDELTQQLNILKQLGHYDFAYKKLFSDIETLEKELELKENQMKEYINSMVSIKHQLSNIMELTQQTTNKTADKKQLEKEKEKEKPKASSSKLNPQNDKTKPGKEDLNKTKKSNAKLEIVPIEIEIKKSKQDEPPKVPAVDKAKIIEQIKELSCKVEELRKEIEIIIGNHSKLLKEQREIESQKQEMSQKYEVFMGAMKNVIEDKQRELKRLDELLRDNDPTSSEELKLATTDHARLTEEIQIIERKKQRMLKQTEEYVLNANKLIEDKQKELDQIDKVLEEKRKLLIARSEELMEKEKCITDQRDGQIHNREKMQVVEEAESPVLRHGAKPADSGMVKLQNEFEKTKNENKRLQETLTKIQGLIRVDSQNAYPDLYNPRTIDNIRDILLNLDSKDKERHLRSEPKLRHSNEKDTSGLNEKTSVNRLRMFNAESPSRKENFDQINSSQDNDLLALNYLIKTTPSDFIIGTQKTISGRPNKTDNNSLNCKRTREKLDENEKPDGKQSLERTLAQKKIKDNLFKRSLEKGFRQGRVPSRTLELGAFIRSSSNSTDKAFDGQNLKKKVKIDK